LDSATFIFIITRSVSEGPGFDQSLAAIVPAYSPQIEKLTTSSGDENTVSTSKVALSNEATLN
jgi:hypothetical protein